MTGKEAQTVIMLEIVAPLAEDVDILPESIRTEIKNRFLAQNDWDTVFAPIPDKDLRNKYIDLFKALDENE